MTIHLRLYEELSDYLPLEKRKRRFDVQLKGGSTVRKLLAHLGVPEAQVELVVVNGDSVDFSHKLKENDFVGIYPVFESFDVTTQLRVRRRPLRQTRFMVGADLYALARHLRLLGFDTVVSRLRSPDKIIHAAEKERRILLTKNAALLRHTALSRGYCIQAAKPQHQVEEVLARFDLPVSAQIRRNACSGV